MRERERAMRNVSWVVQNFLDSKAAIYFVNLQSRVPQPARRISSAQVELLGRPPRHTHKAERSCYWRCSVHTIYLPTYQPTYLPIYLSISIPAVNKQIMNIDFFTGLCSSS